MNSKDKLPLEKQVVSLELAKQLKEAGYPQEGLWWWCEERMREDGKVVGVKIYEGDVALTRKYNAPELNIWVAPTVAELGEVLPYWVWSGRGHDGNGKAVSFHCKSLMVTSYPTFKRLTEAAARAKMWLYLKKEGLL